MSDRPSVAPHTPLHQHPGFLKLCLAVVSIALLWAVVADDGEVLNLP